MVNILEKGKLEVKSERNWWWRTKNIAIEIESYGMPSGIKTTKAKYWVQCLCKGAETYASIILKVSTLKRLCKKYENTKMVGDNKASKVILIPLKEILIYDEEVAKIIVGPFKIEIDITLWPLHMKVMKKVVFNHKELFILLKI